MSGRHTAFALSLSWLEDNLRSAPATVRSVQYGVCPQALTANRWTGMWATPMYFGLMVTECIGTYIIHNCHLS